MTSEREPLKRFTTEITFNFVNPELLEILTGGVPEKPTYAVEIHSPIKRKWWEWLLRRPKQWHTIYIPNATIEQGKEEDDNA